MTNTKYVVASQSHHWVESPRVHVGWHVGNDGQRAPVGLRHAVHVDAAVSACGLPASMLSVFDDLDWTTMLSNEMCPDCKHAAF
jgi:hypothetical protein